MATSKRGRSMKVTKPIFWVEAWVEIERDGGSCQRNMLSLGF